MIADVPQPVFYVQSPESLRGVVPIMPQVAAHPMYYPPFPDPQLHVKIMNQIEYYFRYFIAFFYFLDLLLACDILVLLGTKQLFNFKFCFCSNENLVKDTFLRQNMDEQGWVPIKLIAGFKKVSVLQNLYNYICPLMFTPLWF